MHLIDREIPSEGENVDIIGRSANGKVCEIRRSQLQAHHTGTHIMFAACRNVLGPHIWQAGAKKTLEQAHLDITHYKSLTKEEEIAIENYANRLINNSINITKGFMDKAEAEKKYGFSLYQGGVVPGNSLRVVNIEGVDTEAFCGTHADNTSEVGWVRMIKTQRISDGIVRLYYVAQERAIQVMNTEFNILQKLTETWGVDQSQIEPTATRFFNEYKRLTALTKKQDTQILNLQMRSCIKDTEQKTFFVKSEQDNPTLYIASLPAFAEELKKDGKGIVFIGNTYICGLFGNPASINLPELEKTAGELSSKPIKTMKKDSVQFKFKEKGKKPLNVTGICQFQFTGQDFNVEKLSEFFSVHGLKEMD